MLSILEMIPPIGFAGIGISAFFAWSKARAIDRWMTVYDERAVLVRSMPDRPGRTLLPPADYY